MRHINNTLAAEVERPYRAWGHPYTTWLGITGWFLMSIFMVVSAPQSAVSAAAMIAVSVPVYYGLTRYRA